MAKPKIVPPSELDLKSDDAAESKPKPERLSSMALRADGSIDTESMRDSTKDKLKTVLPRLVADLGVDGGAPVASMGASDFTFLSQAIVQLLGTLEGVMLIKTVGAPPDIAKMVGEFSEPQKSLLIPVSNKLLAKHGGPVLAKWGDEASAVMLLYAMTQEKIALCRALMAERANTAPPAPAPLRIVPAVPVDGPSPSDADLRP